MVGVVVAAVVDQMVVAVVGLAWGAVPRCDMRLEGVFSRLHFVHMTLWESTI